jgi:hypothetical protein
MRNKTLWSDKKGDAFVFLVVIFSIFIVGIYYVVMSQAQDMVFTGINGSVGGIDPRANNTNLVLGSIWQWLPVVILIGFILWAIVQSIRSKNDTGYY